MNERTRSLCRLARDDFRAQPQAGADIERPYRSQRFWRADFEAATPAKRQDPATLDSRRADSDRARKAIIDVLLTSAQSSDEKD